MTDLFWDDFFKLAAVCLLVSGLLTVILRGWRHFRTTEAEAAAFAIENAREVGCRYDHKVCRMSLSC